VPIRARRRRPGRLGRAPVGDLGEPLPDGFGLSRPAGEVGDVGGQQPRRHGREHRGIRRDRPPVPARFAGEDHLFEVAQRRARFDAELIDQRAPDPPVDLQGVGLPAGPVQGEHQMPVQAFPKGMLLDEGGDLTDQVAMATELEFQLNAILNGVEPLRVQTLSERPNHNTVQTGQSRTPPLAQRTAIGLDRLRQSPFVAQSPGTRHLFLETTHVNTVVVDLQHIPGRPGGDPGELAKQTTQRGNTDLHLHP
jgi:hypothetical protein